MKFFTLLTTFFTDLSWHWWGCFFFLCKRILERMFSFCGVLMKYPVPPSASIIFSNRTEGNKAVGGHQEGISTLIHTFRLNSSILATFLCATITILYTQQVCKCVILNKFNYTWDFWYGIGTNKRLILVSWVNSNKKQV